MDTLTAFRGLTRKGDYPGLKEMLDACDLGALVSGWTELEPMEKLVYFKLLDPERAMEFFGRLDFHEKYFLLGGFDLNSIAPILEALPEQNRVLFRPLETKHYDRMLQQLARGQIDVPLSGLNN